MTAEYMTICMITIITTRSTMAGHGTAVGATAGAGVTLGAHGTPGTVLSGDGVIRVHGLHGALVPDGAIVDMHTTEDGTGML